MPLIINNTITECKQVIVYERIVYNHDRKEKALESVGFGNSNARSTCNGHLVLGVNQDWCFQNDR